MTTSPVPDVLTRQAVVSEASQVAGRNGETQWALKLEIKDISQFPIPCFMPLERAAQVLKGSTHLVTMRRGKIKADKDGKYPSHYFWDLTGWDVQAPAPVQVPAAHTPTGWDVQAPAAQAPSATGGSREGAASASVPWDAADTQSRISWAQAVNLAVEALDGQNYRDEQYFGEVEWIANRFYPLIRKGPTAQEEPLFPDSQEGPQEPRNGASASVADSTLPAHFPIWDKKGQTDWQYITGLARDMYKKDQQAFRQLLGTSWAEWVKEHETSEAAIQAAILRLAEE